METAGSWSIPYYYLGLLFRRIVGELHRPIWPNELAQLAGLLGEIQGKPRGTVWGIVGERLVSAVQSRFGGFLNPP